MDTVVTAPAVGTGRGRRNPAAPLKAYEVYHVVDYGTCTRQYSFGIYAGRTPGQARARAIDLSDGVNNPWRGLRSRRVHGPLAEQAIEAAEDAGKYWQDTKRFARLTASAAEFNANWPVGTPVQLPSGCLGYGLADEITLTRTPAWVTLGLQLLVSVEGITGGVPLERVLPLVEPHQYIPLTA